MTPDDADANHRAVVLTGLPQFFPQANPLNIIPKATFGGTNAPANVGVDRRAEPLPFLRLQHVCTTCRATSPRWPGTHNLKAGLFMERTIRPATRASCFNGTFSFNSDNQNPRNTNIGFANGLLGAISEYQESNGHPSGQRPLHHVECFAQDNWRLKKNFTLDVGVRFYFMTPTSSQGDRSRPSIRSDWNAAQAPSSTSRRSSTACACALNPLTGETPPAGLHRPARARLRRLHQRHGRDGTPTELAELGSASRPAPRLRVGRDRRRQDRRSAAAAGSSTTATRTTHPPADRAAAAPQYLHGPTTPRSRELLGAAVDATPPSGARFDEFTPPIVYNWSIGVQRARPWNLDRRTSPTSATPARNQLVTSELNGLPYGSTFQPPEPGSRPNNSQPLPDDLLRPYRGFGGISAARVHRLRRLPLDAGGGEPPRSSDGLAFGVCLLPARRNKSLGAIDPFVEDNDARNYTLERHAGRTTCRSTTRTKSPD